MGGILPTGDGGMDGGVGGTAERSKHVVSSFGPSWDNAYSSGCNCAGVVVESSINTTSAGAFFFVGGVLVSGGV